VSDDVKDVSPALRLAIQEKTGISEDKVEQLIRSERLIFGSNTLASLNQALSQAQLAVNRVIDFVFDTMERLDNGIFSKIVLNVKGWVNVFQLITEGIFGR
jgi:hypothetical protein